MMTLEINQIVATGNSLRFGIIVRYSDNGPIRFVQAVLPDDTLDWTTLGEMAAWVARHTNRHLDHERELEREDPLF
jgi:hypothetical protein